MRYMVMMMNMVKYSMNSIANGPIIGIVGQKYFW